MKRFRLLLICLLLILSLFLSVACKSQNEAATSEDNEAATSEDNEAATSKNADGYVKNGQFYEKDGRRYIYTGDKTGEEYMDISNTINYAAPYSESNMYNVGDTITKFGFTHKVNSISRTKELTPFLVDGFASAGRDSAISDTESYVIMDVSLTNDQEQDFNDVYIGLFLIVFADSNLYELWKTPSAENKFFYDCDLESYKGMRKSYWFEPFSAKQTRHFQIATIAEDELLDSGYAFVRVGSNGVSKETDEVWTLKIVRLSFAGGEPSSVENDED